MLVKPEIPPSGWNSYDCYRNTLDEASALANLDAFVRKLKPFGFTYFVIDAGWHAKYSFAELPSRGGRQERFIDEWGRFIGSPTFFPHGLRAVSDACHAAGVKFGLHLMRGIPTLAVERNTPIKGHPAAHARDIVDAVHQCNWCDYVRAVNADAPGAREFYAAVAEYLLDDLQVDLVKFDDATEYPREIELFAEALDRNPRPVALSLSEGNAISTLGWDIYSRYAAMVRVTGDIWDLAEHAEPRFDRWRAFENCDTSTCHIDLDMLPLGALQVNVREGTAEDVEPMGHCRASRLTEIQKRVLVAQHALARSPLFFGGDLVSSAQSDIDLVTNPDVLACDRDGVAGRQVFLWRHVDVRRAESASRPGHGWLGVFMREWGAHEARTEFFAPSELGFDNGFPPSFRDIWADKPAVIANGRLVVEIPAQGCAFLAY